MSDWLPIRYRGYWDVPRMILVRHANRLYLLDCPFDHELDEYPDHFTVYQLPNIGDGDTPDDWTTLPGCAVRVVGEVPVTAVTFDPTKRAAIRADMFDAIRQPGARPAAAS
jgi:hypothetical protein